MSQSNKLWSHDELVKLISLYENNTILWDINEKEYKNRVKKDSILKDIAEEFSAEISEVSRRLHNLRTQFFNERRKEETKKSGQGSMQNYTSKWRYYDPLKFLIESTKLRPGIENIPIEIRDPEVTEKTFINLIAI